MSLHTGYTIGTSYGPYVRHSLTHSDTLDSDIVWRSLVMEMEVGTRGHRGFGYYSKFANITCATRASPAPAFTTHVRSLRTGVRQRCTCIFLVLILIQVPTQCIIFGRVFYQEPITRTPCAWPYMAS